MEGNGLAQALDTGAVELVSPLREPDVAEVVIEVVEAAEVEQQIEQQVAQVVLTQAKVTDLETEAVRLEVAVKAGRYARLASHAADEGWALDKVPPETYHDPEVRAWWDEWVQLTAEMEQLHE